MDWDEEAMQRHGLIAPSNRQPVPGAIQHVAGLLTPWLKEHGERTALVGQHSRLTYRELEADVAAAVAYLSAEGVVAGTRIAVSMSNHPEIVVAFLAIQRLAAIWVGINLSLAPVEQRYMIEDAGASHLITEPFVLNRLADAGLLPLGLRTIVVAPGTESQWSRGIAAHRSDLFEPSLVDPWAPAGIAYTSGTTGRPKGAVHSQHNMIVAALVTEQLAGYRAPDAVRGTASPLTILNMMIGGPLATLAAGNTHVCCDRTDIQGIAEWVRRERINSMALVPTLIRDLLTSPTIAPADLCSLKWVVIGAAMVPEGMGELYEARFGHAPSIGYGLTEAPTVVSRTQACSPRVRGAIGRPAPHLEVAIFDDAGGACAVNEIGEICIRACNRGEWAGVYTPPLGYWNKPEESATLLRGGWLHTGDIGRIDAGGELFIEARRSDLIVRGGANVYPAEVESVVLRHPDVQDCAVIGVPDERLGEIVVAYVQTEPATDAARLIDEIRTICQRELAKYKLPAFWHILPHFPRNAMGKTIKAQLRPPSD